MLGNMFEAIDSFMETEEEAVTRKGPTGDMISVSKILYDRIARPILH